MPLASDDLAAVVEQRRDARALAAARDSRSRCRCFPARTDRRSSGLRARARRSRTAPARCGCADTMRAARSSTITPSVAVSRIALSSLACARAASSAALRSRRPRVGGMVRSANADSPSHGTCSSRASATCVLVAEARDRERLAAALLDGDVAGLDHQAVEPARFRQRVEAVAAGPVQERLVGIEQMAQPIDQHADRQPVEERPRLSA